jgi:predicted dehydrogenase
MPALGKLRVAVVGCGLIGRRRAAEAARHQATTLTRVADVDLGRALQVAGPLGAAAGADWREVVDDPAVDIVSVATPNAYLAPIAIAAMEHGKHVLIEKPPGRNLDEARRIAAAWRKNPGLVLTNCCVPARLASRLTLVRATDTAGGRVMTRNGAVMRNWPAEES